MYVYKHGIIYTHSQWLHSLVPPVLFFILMQTSINCLYPWKRSVDNRILNFAQSWGIHYFTVLLLVRWTQPTNYTMLPSIVQLTGHTPQSHHVSYCHLTHFAGRSIGVWEQTIMWCMGITMCTKKLMVWGLGTDYYKNDGNHYVH